MHAVPVSARISFVYVEKGVLEQDGHSLVLCQGDRLTPIPIGRTSTLLIGPGTSVTHAAVRLCANEGTLLAWVGEHGVRLYGAGNPRGNPDALLRQTGLRLDEAKRLSVARATFKLMFGEDPPPRLSIEQLRGLEGSRVKKWYEDQAAATGVTWAGKDAGLHHPINRALAGCNAALYGLTEAVIVALGYSPSIGFVHSGDDRSFVFDVADTVKFHTVAPLAFELVTKHGDNLSESLVRKSCRDVFFQTQLSQKLVENITELMHGNAGH